MAGSFEEQLVKAFETVGQTPFGMFLQEQHFALLGPEILVLVILLSCIIQSFGRTEEKVKGIWGTAMLGVASAFAFILFQLIYLFFPGGLFIGSSFDVMFGMFRADLFSMVIRTLMLGGGLLVLLMTRRYLDRNTTLPGEFYVLFLGALLGSMLLAGATDLIMLFVALETLGISSFIMAGYLRGNQKSIEASLKYLVYGAVSSAILLFGFSLLYGFAKSTQFDEIALAVTELSGPMLPLIPVMAVLILAGFAFKLSAAPFHMWAPDVYEGAPTPVTAFLSVVSKIAGFAVTVRLLYGVLAPLETWFAALAIISVLSMTVGNVVALCQRNIKRLLAYSTIAHAGYILLGLVSFTEFGTASLMYYLLTYLFMNLGAFAVVIHFSNVTGSDEIASYAGLVKRRPGLTLAFSFFLLSLAGMPITAGFFAKFFLFQSLASVGTQHIWLIIVALINSTISLYYYLNVMRVMVISEPSKEVLEMPSQDDATRPASLISMAMAISLLGTLLLGFYADPLINLSRESARQLSVTGQGGPIFQMSQVPAE